MNTSPIFTIAAALSAVGLLHAQADPFAAWTHRAAVTASTPGLTRVELPREVLDASRAVADTVPLRDLRLVSAAGVETPFLIEWPRIVPGRTLAAENFKASLQGSTTVIEFTVPGDAVVEEVRLQTGHRDFIKAATVEGTLDGTQWRVISDRELVFRQGGAERLRFTFTPTAWKSLRITLDDQRNGPVGFTGATLLAHEEDESPFTTEDIPILSRNDANGETRLRLDLGARNRHLHSLRVVAADPLFQREVNLDVVREDGTTGAAGRQRTIYRIALDDRRSEDVDVPQRQVRQERIVELRIRNGDNPPLRIERIEGRFSRMALVFHAETAGTWHLLTGNANAFGPRYDVAALLGDLSKTNVATASVSALEPNPAFRKETTTPEAGESGAPLDVTAWAFRRPVNFKDAGVVRVELDAEALAHATLDQRDVRVMQEGRQLPYFIERGLPWREVEVKFQQEPDAKRPTVSRWRVELPMAGHPIVRLIATSPTAIFDRQIRAWEDGRDAYGNSFRRPLGDASWKRTPGQPASALSVHVPTRPAGDVVFLETDNGDNAPLQLDSMRLAFSPANVVFKTTSTAPVELVYGNPRASAPRYDIQLVRAQFERIGGTNATLGAESRAEGHKKASAASPGVGSAWLWGALALVVGGLLWIVARLLPAETAK